MKRSTIIILCSVVLLGAGLAFVLWPRSHRSISVTDVSHPFSVWASSPALFHGSGAFYLIVEGQLDGDAVLELFENHGKNRWQLPLHTGHISIANGGTEEWADDVRAEYRPLTTKRGQIYVSLYCGAGLTPDDHERYLRIERDPH